MKKFFAMLVVIFTICPAFSQDYFTLGKQSFAKQDYRNAEKQFISALKTSQNNWACRYFLATTYVKENEIAKAKQEYAKIIAYAPNSKEAALSRQSLVNLNKYTTAKTAITNIQGDNYIDGVKFEGRYVKWRQFPINVYVVPSDYELLIKQAFLTWEKATGDLVNFTFVNTPQSAPIKVHMTKELATSEEGTEAGLATINVSGNYITRADIQLLLTDTKTGENLSDNIIFSTAIHEIGHALGIQGHSPDNNDIMSAKNTVGLKTLTKRDLTTLKMLYR